MTAGAPLHLTCRDSMTSPPALFLRGGALTGSGPAGEFPGSLRLSRPRGEAEPASTDRNQTRGTGLWPVLAQTTPRDGLSRQSLRLQKKTILRNLRLLRKPLNLSF